MLWLAPVADVCAYGVKMVGRAEGGEACIIKARYGMLYYNIMYVNSLVAAGSYLLITSLNVAYGALSPFWHIAPLRSHV